MAEQELSFAFIKATEGSTFVDKQFSYNWESASKTGLRVGAYHFFSYDSGGTTQAENFIKTVPLHENALPPVVDIEFYGDKEENRPTKAQTDAILLELLGSLEAHYGKKPILYATMKSYTLYLQEDYMDYPIWIRDVLKKPSMPDGRAWTFWQYSNRGRLAGYAGAERFIDLNVFAGSVEEFQKLY